MRFSWDTTARADKTPEQVDDDICELLHQHSGDRHIDGHEEITDYVLAAVAAEREACAKLADELSGPFPGVGLLRDVKGVAAAIRSRGAK